MAGKKPFRMSDVKIIILLIMGLLIGVCLPPAHAASPTGLSISVSKAAPQRINTAIRVTATVTGGDIVEYQFLVGTIIGDTITWSMLSPYSALNQATWRPATVGTYRLEVWTRNVGQTVDYAARAYRNYVIISSPLTAISLSITPDAPQPALTPFTLTAMPVGSGVLQFQFLVGLPLPDGSLSWQVLQDFSSALTCSWLPKTAGSYVIKVNARQGWAEAAVISAQATLGITAPRLTARATPQQANSATGSTPTITPYHGNKTAAVSYTFDDGQETQIIGAVPLLNQFGFKGTFFLIAGFAPDHNPTPTDPNSSAGWDEWKQVLAQGHELGSHSMTHPHLVPITDEIQLYHEVHDSATLIFSKTGQFPKSFAYPFDEFSPSLHNLVLSTYAAARESDIFFGGSTFTTTYANGVIDQAIANGQWVAPLLHGIDAGGYDPVPSSELSKHFQYVQGLQNQVWVDTFGNISRYVKERDNALLQVNSTTTNSIIFTLTCSLYAQLFNYPLTVEIPTDPTTPVKSVQALRQATSEVLPTTVIAGGILVDVVPGNAPVTVTWTY